MEYGIRVRDGHEWGFVGQMGGSYERASSVEGCLRISDKPAAIVVAMKIRSAHAEVRVILFPEPGGLTWRDTGIRFVNEPMTIAAA